MKRPKMKFRCQNGRHALYGALETENSPSVIHMENWKYLHTSWPKQNGVVKCTHACRCASLLDWTTLDTADCAGSGGGGEWNTLVCGNALVIRHEIWRNRFKYFFLRVELLIRIAGVALEGDALADSCPLKTRSRSRAKAKKSMSQAE
jgi:hypothetical protein